MSEPRVAPGGDTRGDPRWGSRDDGRRGAGPGGPEGQFGPRADPRAGGRPGARPGSRSGERPDPRSGRPDPRLQARAGVRDDPRADPRTGSRPDFQAAPVVDDRTGPRTMPPRGMPTSPRGEPGREAGQQPSRRRRAAGHEDGTGPHAGLAGDVDAPGRGSRLSGRAAGGRPRRGGKRPSRMLIWVAGGGVAAVAVLVIGLMLMLGPGGPKHVLLTPTALGQYVRRPQLEAQMDANQLKQQVIARSAGQASHVVSAVYENSAGVAGRSAPQIFLFIGGNLSGTSPSDFINGFTGQFRGAVITNAGSMGGQAVCVNAQASIPGTVALCAWADNDTFGVLASPTMHAVQLGAQMRLIRPGVEHIAK